MKMFLAAALFFDVLRQFGELSPEVRYTNHAECVGVLHFDSTRPLSCNVCAFSMG